MKNCEPTFKQKLKVDSWNFTLRNGIKLKHLHNVKYSEDIFMSIYIYAACNKNSRIDLL